MGRGWLACEHPERPPDPFVEWHLGGPECRGCLLKIEAQERRFPDDSHVKFVADLLRRMRDDREPDATSITDACREDRGWAS